MLKEKRFIIIALIFLLMVISSSVAAQGVSRSPRINFNGITGDDFIGQAGLLYPFRNTEDSLWFTDFRYRMSSDDIDEWNLGLGYRKKLENYDNRLAGAYIFKDMRNEYDHDWDMWTIGGEILTDQWDFRVNGYLTDDETIDDPQNDEVIVKSQKLYYDEGFISSMNGLDFEVGKRFVDRDDLLKNIGVYVKLFSFFEDNTDTIFGHQLRVDKQFGDLNKTTWKLGAKWRDDDVRGSEIGATFAVSIPFGKGKAEDTGDRESAEEIVEARMTEQPERDLDIVVVESDDPDLQEAKNLDGSSLGNVFYVSAEGTGDGSSKSSPTNIVELNTLASEDDVIIFMGDDGTIENSNYSLKNGQKLLSAAGELILTSENLEKQTVFSPDVEQAVLSNSVENELNDILVLADNTMVSGIEFNNGNNIINGSGISGDITITNNKFINGNKAININNTSEDSEDSIDNLKVEISKNIIESSLEHGIYIVSENNNTDDNYKLSVEDNIIKSSRGNGIYIDSYTDTGNSEIVIQNNLVEDTYYYPIELDVYSDGELSQLHIANNTINNSDYGSYDGMDISLNGSVEYQVDIKDNLVENIYDDGIYLNNNADGKLTVNLENNKIDDVSDYGIYLYSNNNYSNENEQIFNIKNNLIEDVDDYGIRFYNYNNNGKLTVNLENNKIVDARYTGIYLNSYNDYSNDNDQIFNIKNNLIEDVDDYGIRFYYRRYNNNTNGNLTVNLENNKITDARYSGIYVDSYNDYSNENEQIFNIKNNLIEDVDDYGIRFSYRGYEGNTNGKLTVNLENNKIYNIGDRGIYLYSYNDYYSSNISNTEIKYNIINNELENIREDALYVNIYNMGNIETNFMNNEMNNIGSDGFAIDNYGSKLSGEISGNIIDYSDYAVILNGYVYNNYYNNNRPAIYEEYFVISENEFNGSGSTAIYLNNDDSSYGSEINVEVNDNLINDNINVLIQEDGDNINITGNQKP